MIGHGLVAISAFVLTMLLMPSAVLLASRFGAIDQPDARKIHRQAIARLGGVGFVLAFLILSLLTVSLEPASVGVLAGLLIIFLVGFLDDIRPLSPKAKFLGQIAATLVFVLVSGASLKSLGDLFGFGPVELGWFAIPFTLFAMVGVINAMNLSDGLDGLASGLAIISLIFFGFFALRSGHEICFQFVLIFLFCLFGFLYFNHHPARIFMGDCGSMSIGFFLAAMAVLLVQPGNHVKTPVEPVSMVVVLGLPIVDTLLVMCRRFFRGEKPFAPDKTHLHHRLMDLGLPHSGVVGMMYAMMLVMGLASVFWVNWQPWQQFYGAILLVLVGFSLVIMAQHAGFRLIRVVPQAPAFTRSRHSRRMLRLLGRSVRWVTWLMLGVLLLASFQVSGVPQTQLQWLGFILLVGLLLFPWRHHQNQKGLAYGVIYLFVLSLLLSINSYAGSAVVALMNLFSLLLLFWVAIKFSFQRNGHVILVSGFEVLILIMAFVVPWLGSQLALISETSLTESRNVALAAIPWMMACKIIIRRQPHRNRSLVLIMAGALAMIMLRSL